MVALASNGKESLDALVANLTATQIVPFVLGATTADGELYFNSGGPEVLNDPTSGTIDQDAVFWICSMTKLITHIAALQLIDQGKLALETPVSQYLPQLLNPIVIDNIMSPSPTFKPAKNVIRVEHLLNFSSGLYYELDKNPGIAMSDSYASPHVSDDPHTEFFSLVQHDLPGVPLQFEPGTDFAYGYSSDVLGFVVEKVSGKTLDQYMQDNIFGPLNIRASFFLTPDLQQRLFPLYHRNEDGMVELWNDQPGTRILEHDHTKVRRLLGGVGLYTSLRDYLKLLRHILQVHDGKAEHPILKQDTVKKIFVGNLPEKAAQSLTTFMGYMSPDRHQFSWSNACGVCENDWPGSRKKGTAFWSGWAGTHFFIDPTTGVAGVFGSQLSTPPFTGAVDADLLRGLYTFEETLYANLV